MVAMLASWLSYCNEFSLGTVVGKSQERDIKMSAVASYEAKVVSFEKLSRTDSMAAVPPPSL